MTKWLAPAEPYQQVGKRSLMTLRIRVKLVKVFPSLTVGNHCITLGVNIR